MMGFIEEIKNCFTPDELPNEPIYRAVIFGDGAVYFENVCYILRYTECEISFCLKKGGIVVSGENLYIKKYCAGDLVVCGKIKRIERV